MPNVRMADKRDLQSDVDKFMSIGPDSVFVNQPQGLVTSPDQRKIYMNLTMQNKHGLQPTNDYVTATGHIKSSDVTHHHYRVASDPTSILPSM